MSEEKKNLASEILKKLDEINKKLETPPKIGITTDEELIEHVKNCPSCQKALLPIFEKSIRQKIMKEEVEPLLKELSKIVNKVYAKKKKV